MHQQHLQKNSSLFNIFFTSAIIFITCPNRNDMTNSMTYKDKINNTSVITFLIGSPTISSQFPFCTVKAPFYVLRGLCSISLVSFNLTKLPKRYLRENFQEVSVMLVVVVVLSSLTVFHSLLFEVIPHDSVSYRRFYIPILYYQPSSLQSYLPYFHFKFSGLFILQQALRFLSGHLLLACVF